MMQLPRHFHLDWRQEMQCLWDIWNQEDKFIFKIPELIRHFSITIITLWHYYLYSILRLFTFQITNIENLILINVYYLQNLCNKFNRFVKVKKKTSLFKYRIILNLEPCYQVLASFLHFLESTLSSAPNADPLQDFGCMVIYELRTVQNIMLISIYTLTCFFFLILFWRADLDEDSPIHSYL